MEVRAIFVTYLLFFLQSSLPHCYLSGFVQQHLRLQKSNGRPGTREKYYNTVALGSKSDSSSENNQWHAAVLAAALLAASPEPSLALRSLDNMPDLPDTVKPGMSFEGSPEKKIDTLAPDYFGKKPQWMKANKAAVSAPSDDTAVEIDLSSGVTENDPSSISASSTPKFEAPKFNKPDFSSFKLPEVPKVELPEVPKIDLPSGAEDNADAPAISAPKFEASLLKIPETPKVDSRAKLGDASDFVPTVPSFSVPKFSLPSSTNAPESSLATERAAAEAARQESNAAKNEASLEASDAQREKDTAAKEAADVLKQKLLDVKEAEKTVEQAKKEANTAKKAAKRLRDKACKTRPGGKVLCLRNPFDASTQY